MKSSAKTAAACGSLLALGLLLAACGGAANASGTTAKANTPSTTKASVTTLPAPAAKYVKVGGKMVKVPTEVKTYPINPVSDTGQNVIIYEHSFAPHTLYAKSGTVVFTNLTDQPVKITMDEYPTPSDQLSSGEIAPGGTFKFHHVGTLALKYQGSNGSFGYLDVDTVAGL